MRREYNLTKEMVERLHKKVADAKVATDRTQTIKTDYSKIPEVYLG